MGFTARESTGRQRHARWGPLVAVFTAVLGACIATPAPAGAATAGRLVQVGNTGNGNDTVNAVRVLDDGAVAVVGTFVATTTLGTPPSTVTLTPMGAGDGFVAVYEPDGALRWARSFVSNGIDSGDAVDVDASGNVYVAGSIGGTTTFASGPTVNAFGDAFAARYTSTGAVSWVRRIGGGSAEHGLAVAVDRATGNVWLGGTYASSAVSLGLYPGTTFTNSGGDDGFYVKLFANGTVNIGGVVQSPLNDAVRSIAMRSHGNVVLGGHAGQTTIKTIGVADVGFGSAGGVDGFVLALNYSTQHQWLVGVHGTGTDSVAAVAVTLNGGTVFAGQAGGDVVTWGRTNGATDALLGYTYDGATSTIRLVGGYHTDEITALSVAPGGGGVWASGFALPPAAVVGVPIGNGGGGSDAFVLRYVPLFGTVDTVTPVATGSGNGKAKGIGATSTGYVAVGLFSGTATFGKTAPPSLTTPGDNDGFIYAV